MKLGVQLSIKKCGQSTVDSFHGESCHMCISSNWVLHSLKCNLWQILCCWCVLVYVEMVCPQNICCLLEEPSASFPVCPLSSLFYLFFKIL